MKSEMNFNSPATNRNHRRGSMITECLVAASVLVLGIGIVAKSNSSLMRLWEDTRCQQLALDELTNQLSYLTRLDDEDLQQALDQLAVSPEIAATLIEARLEGIRIQDEFGDRIELSIHWQQLVPMLPMKLTGWISQRSQR
jgi:hypothetical protein